MSESKTVIFYDFACSKHGVCWNPNTIKTRLTLNYKGIPYKTECLEYHEIEPKCKEKGILPTRTMQDGRPGYTLPAIWDPTTNAGISESYRIAKYLDETYPDTPPVLFDGIEKYDDIINGCPNLPELKPLVFFLMPSVPPWLNPVSKEYYIRTRQPMFGKKWEEIMPTGKDREDKWKQVEKGFATINRFLKENERPAAKEGELTYLDIALGARTYGLRLLWGQDSELWQDMAAWQDGRWREYAEKMEKYMTSTDDTN